jgi:hypothetical protein
MRYIHTIIKKTFLAIAITGLFCAIATAQDQSQGKTEATIELSYHKKEDMTKSAIAVVKAKNNEGKFVSAKNAAVNFFVADRTGLHLIKNEKTDDKGVAIVSLQKNLPLDDSLYFTIVANIENDSLYEDVEEKVHYKDASLSLNLDPKDTARLLTIRVTETGKDGNEIPVKDAVLKIYVQRMFGIMPAIEENEISTDENGETSFAFPKNIPGDTAGIITVAVRMEDNEQFGNVENKANAYWGTMLAKEKDPFPRALWEPNAPLPLIITICTLFGGVWCVYFFIFFQMHKIKKERAEIIHQPQ